MAKPYILVTGGAGFIGAHLVNRLKEKYNIVIVDSLRSVGGISYVAPEAELINSDICDTSLYPKLLKYDFSAIYHLAAQSAGESAYDDPKFDILTNSYGTWLLAKYASENGIPRFIYTSTVAVYGSSNGEAFREDSPIMPDSIYGVSKYSGELFIRQILGKSKTDFTVFRLFNTYGPGENLNYKKKGMVSIYASYMWRKEPVVVKGALDRYRDFTYIEDTVEVLYNALGNERSFGNTYNLSSGEKTVIKDLLKEMVKAAGLPLDHKIEEKAGTPGDSFGTHASIDKLREDFGWAPRYTLSKGLSEYFEWIGKVPVIEDLSGYHPFQMNK